MSPRDERKPLTALARSIDSLFPAEEVAESPEPEGLGAPEAPGSAGPPEVAESAEAVDRVREPDQPHDATSEEAGTAVAPDSPEEEVALPARGPDPASTWFDADGARSGRRREYRLVKSDLYMDVEFVSVDDDEEAPDDPAAAAAEPGDEEGTELAETERTEPVEPEWTEPALQVDEEPPEIADVGTVEERAGVAESEELEASSGTGRPVDAVDEEIDAEDVPLDVGSTEERELAPEDPGKPEGEGEEGAEGGAATRHLPPPRHTPRPTRSPWITATVDDLRGAVEEYLMAGGARRDELSRRIRELAAKLQEARELDALADSVERLIVIGNRDGGQEAPVTLARMLVTPEVATVLVARLGSARDDGRRRQLMEIAAAAPEELGPVVGEALATTDDRPARRTYIETLVAMGGDVRGVVADMIEDPRWFVVRNAVLILGEIGDEPAVEHLTGTLGHSDGRVRRETLMALMKIGGDDAEMLVQSRLDDADPEVRWAAVRAAGELGIEKAVRPLLAQLDDEEVEDVEVAILRTLGQLGDPGAVPAIEKRATKGFFSRTPTKVRVAAYRALGAIGTPHALELLEEAVDDRDSAVASAAKDALGRARTESSSDGA